MKPNRLGECTTCGKYISIVALTCPHCGETTLRQIDYILELKCSRLKSLVVDKFTDDDITADEREVIVNYVHSSPSYIRAEEICNELMDHYYEQKYKEI